MDQENYVEKMTGTGQSYFKDSSSNVTYMQSSPSLTKSAIDDNVSMNSHNGGGGDDGMDKYVTKTELELSETRTNAKVDVIEQKIVGRFDTLDQNINNLEKSLPDKLRLSIRDEFDKRDTQRKETNHFILGTLIIGGISLIVSIVSMFI